uniref:Uncharacterized protein n=1 Tax=Panagrolaimus sp. ES5 TaxID=591445 RepID=A0AC34GHK9_9BILA
RGKHFKDRRTDRYYDDRHYESRRYEDRDRRHDRHRDDRHHHSRHRTHRHYDHSDRRDGHSHSHRRRSNSPQRSKRQYSQSPERTKKSSPHVSRKQSPVREHRSVFAKDIKIEIPDTSPIIKSESPPEILSKNSSPAISIVSSSAPAGVSPSINTNLTSSQSNKNVISIETVFPDAPKPIQQPSNDFSSFYSTPPPGTGPKFRSTMQFQGFANTRATKPPPIRFGGFQRPAFHQRFVQPVRLPIIIPPPPQIPSQFVP